MENCSYTVCRTKYNQLSQQQLGILFIIRFYVSGLVQAKSTPDFFKQNPTKVTVQASYQLTAYHVFLLSANIKNLEIFFVVLSATLFFVHFPIKMNLAW